jgi:cytochrome c biogenesis protein CcmG/thiol:disulfide interchange protein DsbE
VRDTLPLGRPEEHSLATSLSRPLIAAPLLVFIAAILIALGTVLVRRTGDDDLASSSSGPDGLAELQTRVAPDFELATFDGSTVRAADLKGQPAVMNFWSSWCVPCQREMPLLTRVAKEYEPKSVAFVGVAIWDAKSDAQGFLTRYGAGYPAGLDERGTIAIEFGVRGLPETYFIRPDGSLTRRWIGELNEPTLRRFIEEIRA